MFDSPFDLCVVCGQYVLLDQTQKQCAREHECKRVSCPLRQYFTGMDFSRGSREPPDEGATGR